ncbi:MAG: TonB-dependent receptor [Bacteroidota bacterium]
MRRIFLAAVAAFFLTISLSGQAVVGTITDQSNGDELAGVAIQIVGTSSGTLSEADGRFTLALPAFGPHEILVSYLGYRQETIKVSVSPDAPTVAVGIELSTQAFTTEELIVSATRADEKTPVTYVNLDTEDIADNNQGQDLPFVLKWTPSVVVTSDAGAGIGYTGIWIRGSDPTRTNTTINGVPLNDSESQGTFWVNLPDFASSVDEIQVQRGVGTSTNGAGSFGASININTNQLKEEAYGGVTAGIGSFGTQRGNLKFGTGVLKNGFTVDGRLSRIISDGYIDRGSSNMTGYYLSAAKVGEKSVLRLNAFGGHEITYQSWNGIDASLVNDRVLRRTNTAGTERAGLPYENEVDNYRQQHYQLHYDLELNDLLVLDLTGHYTRGLGYFEQYKADEDLADYNITATTPGGETVTNSDLIRRRWLDNDFYGLLYNLRFQTPDAKTSATLGGSYNVYQGDHFGEVIWSRFAGNSEIRDRYYDNDAQKTDINFFGKVQHEVISGLSAYVDLQVRLVDYDFEGINLSGNPVQEAASLSFFNPKAGLYYDFGNGGAAYASFGIARREPNRNDFVDNPLTSRPRPERLANTEIGFRKTSRRAQIGINFYHMHYRDQLVLNGQLNDVGEYIRINVPNSYRLGIELQGGYAFTERLSAAANLTLSRNRVKNYTEFLDDYDENFGWLGQTTIEREDTPLAFSPDVMGGAQIEYQILNSKRQQLAVTLMGKFVGERYLDNSGDENNTLDAYFYSDARLQYSIEPGFMKKINISLQVNNVFDELYSANGWSYRYRFAGEEALDQGLYPQATRNFLLNVGLEF